MVVSPFLLQAFKQDVAQPVKRFFELHRVDPGTAVHVVPVVAVQVRAGEQKAGRLPAVSPEPDLT